MSGFLTTRAEVALGGEPLSAGINSKCMHCYENIHSVLNRSEGGLDKFLWVHSDRATIFRTQYCNTVFDLSTALFPE
jgi:hypothetical protein